MKKLIVIPYLLFTMLVGCGNFQKNFVEPTPIPAATTQRVMVDPKSLEPCQTLPTLQPKPSYDNIAEHYILIIGLYGNCMLKQSSSIQLIRKLSNLDNP